MDDISTKRLIEPVAIGSFKLAVMLIGGTLLFVMLASGFSRVAVVATCTLGLLMGLLVLFPLEQVIRVFKGKSAMAALARDGRAAMVAFIGQEPLAVDTCGSLSKEKQGFLSASGIAWDGQKLYVLDSGTVGAFPMSAVRSWTWRTERAALTSTYGNVSASTQRQVAEDNASARAAAFKDGGLFVSVSDIAKPTWQFMTDDVAVLERWDEILRQVREGRLAA